MQYLDRIVCRVRITRRTEWCLPLFLFCLSCCMCVWDMVPDTNTQAQIACFCMYTHCRCCIVDFLWLVFRYTTSLSTSLPVLQLSYCWGVMYMSLETIWPHSQVPRYNIFTISLLHWTVPSHLIIATSNEVLYCSSLCVFYKGYPLVWCQTFMQALSTVCSVV